MVEIFKREINKFIIRNNIKSSISKILLLNSHTINSNKYILSDFKFRKDSNSIYFLPINDFNIRFDRHENNYAVYYCDTPFLWFDAPKYVDLDSSSYIFKPYSLFVDKFENVFIEFLKIIFDKDDDTFCVDSYLYKLSSGELEFCCSLNLYDNDFIVVNGKKYSAVDLLSSSYLEELLYNSKDLDIYIIKSRFKTGLGLNNYITDSGNSYFKLC